MNIDLTMVTAILVCGALLMVPVLGLTLRLVVPPIIDAVARNRAAREAAGSRPAERRRRDPVETAPEASAEGRALGDLAVAGS